MSNISISAADDGSSRLTADGSSLIAL